MKSGMAREWDHSTVAHCIWKLVVKLNLEMWLDRVPSSLNIADPPSRGEHGLLQGLNAEWVTSVLDDMFWKPESWKSLRLRHDQFTSWKENDAPMVRVSLNLAA